MQMRGRRVSVVSTLKTQPGRRRAAAASRPVHCLSGSGGADLSRSGYARGREPGSRDTRQRSPTSAAALDAFDKKAKQTVLEAVKFAEQSPELPVEDVYKYAYFKQEKK